MNAFGLPPRPAIRATTYAVKARLDAPGFLVGGCFVRDRRTAEAIATVIQTVADADRRFELVNGYIRNEAENVAGWNGWAA